MALSRRFYKKLAAEYKDNKPAEGTSEYVVWHAMVIVTARTINEEASGFRTDIFIEAAGIVPQQR